MFSVTAQQAQNRAALKRLFEQFDDDTEVWRGDAGDLLIGDGDDLDEDDTAAYTLAGTVAEYLADITGDA